MNQYNNINSAKQTIKLKALDIADKMGKLNDHLEIIKDMDIKDAKEIYNKEKDILIRLYDYYCKFEKLYLDISFSQILNPVDIVTIRNMDIKDFVNQLKEHYKHDYEITIEFLQEDDKIYIKNIYEELKLNTDNLVSLLINIQSDIIIQEVSPIEQSAVLEKIKNNLNPNLIFDSFKNIENNYLKYLDEYGASKEIF